MKIDCISDLHGEYPTLQGGDLLIVAGDLTGSDNVIQYAHFSTWLHRQNYKKKVLISGNHDGYLEKLGFENVEDVYCSIGIDYLFDSGIEFEGLKIWGSPWSKLFKGINPHCTAFTGDEELLASKYALIPDDIDILITHEPPFGTLDYKVLFDGTHFHLGSTALREALDTRFPNLKLHVFGHIHEAYGIHIDDIEHTSINASYMNGDYEAVNKPIGVIL